MEYTVIHSEDPYLLARMATDLQMNGIKDDRIWNDKFHPMHKYNDESNPNSTFTYLHVGDKNDKDGFGFYSHDSGQRSLQLTSRNYLSILKKVLV